MVRIIARVDANQAEIVAALEGAGATIIYLHQLGGGTPDILVGFRGKCYLMEIKSERGKLTPDQVAFMAWWRGHAAVIHSVDEALDFLSELEAK